MKPPTDAQICSRGFKSPKEVKWFAQDYMINKWWNWSKAKASDCQADVTFYPKHTINIHAYNIVK